MKALIKNITSRVIYKAYRRLPFVGGDGYDISELMKLNAAMDTAKYCIEHLPRARGFPSALALLSYALEQVTLKGLFLEFGVASGLTINHLARRITERIHGFDSFQGLPEDWRTGYERGHFSQKTPIVEKNVVLHVGWFGETLPHFVQEHSEPVAFLHVDCDLYSSTKEIFRQLDDRVTVGSVIVFDEYFNHPTWREDEFKAFHEFISDKNLNYEYIGYVPSHQQAAVMIK